MWRRSTMQSCPFERMVILEDTRQQAGKHRNVHAWMEAHGVSIRRTKLLCGDYTLPADQRVCIDTKYGLAEVYADLIGKDHARFVRELEQARACGIRLVILVEERGMRCLNDVQYWKNPRAAQWQRTPKALRAQKPPVPSEMLMRIMATVAEKHGCEWRFCAKSQTGRIIYDILTGGEKDDG